MKILMIGLGSIGQRHLRNIKREYGDEYQISAYRVRGFERTFSDDMKIRSGINVEEEYNIRLFSDLDEALNDKPDIVYITNITAKHMEYAIKAANAGCDIFLEKPISDSMDGISNLCDAVKANRNIVYVGYQNRFHPCIQNIIQILNDKRIGRIISVENEFSERLTTMHSYEDYSSTYMARKDMGGGPILNLQIHSLDYLQFLFGTPVSVYSFSDNGCELNIDVEDCSSSLYIFKSWNGNKIPIYSHTDFFQYPPAHRLKIVGTKGRIDIDFNNASYSLYIEDEPLYEYKYDDFNRNDMFIQEMKDFMYCVSNRIEPEINLNQGIISLKMALAAKKSVQDNRVVLLEEIK